MCLTGEVSAEDLFWCGHCEEANNVHLRDESQDVTEIGEYPGQR